MIGAPGLSDVVAHLPKTGIALEFAHREHAGQRRSSDRAPFVEHPIEVGWLLYRAGAPDHVIAAGVLHDVLEKTAVTMPVLRAHFGSRVARLVVAVTEDPAIPGYAKRKAALRRQVALAGTDALSIFAADKVSKVRELRTAIANAAQARQPLKASLLPPRRLAHLRQCLGMLEESLGEDSLVQLLSVELRELGRALKLDADIPAAA